MLPEPSCLKIAPVWVRSQFFFWGPTGPRLSHPMFSISIPPPSHPAIPSSEIMVRGLLFMGLNDMEINRKWKDAYLVYNICCIDHEQLYCQATQIICTWPLCPIHYLSFVHSCWGHLERTPCHLLNVKRSSHPRDCRVVQHVLRIFWSAPCTSSRLIAKGMLSVKHLYAAKI